MDLFPLGITVFAIPVGLAITNALLLRGAIRNRVQRSRDHTRQITEHMQLQALFREPAPAEREAA